MRLKSLQQLHGWWAGGFQNRAFAAEGHAESRRPADGRGELVEGMSRCERAGPRPVG